MMQQTFKQMFVGALIVVGGWLAAAPGHAAGPSELYWYDGQQKRPLWLDGGRVADFNGSERSHAAVVKAMPSTKAVGKGMSPVYRDASSAEARARALPGGVIVQLRRPMPEDQARTWLKDQGLTAVREVGTGSGIWLVDSEPGNASLQLANKLYESGQFVSASPNWWQPRTTK